MAYKLSLLSKMLQGRAPSTTLGCHHLLNEAPLCTSGNPRVTNGRPWLLGCSAGFGAPVECLIC